MPGLSSRRWPWLSWPERTQYRILEILPGAFVVGTLALAVVLSFLAPLWAIAFIVVFDLYWLIRVVYIMIYLILAFVHFRRAVRVDWMNRLKTRPGWRSVYHVILLPVATESLAVLEATFTSLDAVEYPHDRMIIVLAIEGRNAAANRANATALKARFGPRFADLLVFEHPADIPGEVAAKGANIAWAGRQLRAYLDDRGRSYDQVLVSTFDADSVAHPQYFSYLTDTFLTHPRRLRTSYQPIPLFHNNAWDALALMRVVSNSTTFWLLSETTRPDRLFTFSSHSMPFRALVDVDFWQTDVVNEDSRIFLQCLLRYDGDYTVTPMYIPISMDAVQSETMWRSLINQYKQIRRWAYGGVENFPYMVWNFWRDGARRWRQKLKYVWMQWEGIYSWATAPLLILILGWLPFHTRPAAIDESALAQNAPLILRDLMGSAMIGLVISAILSTILLPARPARVQPWRWLTMIGQWILLPVTMIVFGAIPALEAQVRMMFGKYLGFWVTEKARTPAAQDSREPTKPG